MLLKTDTLTPETKAIICHQATEYPGTGEYNEFNQPGTYLCRNCGLALFRGTAKFHSGCGWPSFDQEIKATVIQQLDEDRHRSEILCVRCNAHLGHVFAGEGFTPLNIRHCVNSLALDFVTDTKVLDSEEAILAAGCFWGVEYYLQKLAGVLKTEVGYTGGHKDYPTYAEVCNHTTGHLEAIRVVYDQTRLSYEQLLKYFFEIHDPTQTNGQGADIGEQYLSAIFYYNEVQLATAQHVVALLGKSGFSLATRLLPVSTFWRAEEYHQNYYHKQAKQPYCHFWQQKFRE
jgi:peptide methionine sulfoxide reductase msrA/msrB